MVYFIEVFLLKLIDTVFVGSIILSPLITESHVILPKYPSFSRTHVLGF